MIWKWLETLWWTKGFVSVHPIWFRTIVTLIAAWIVIQVAVFATTIFLHRSATHRAVVLHPLANWAFRAALWLTTGLVTREWVAVHRKHHAFTDEEGDPHSPKLLGFWPVQLGNVFYYVREARNRETIERYASDLKDDWWDKNLFNHRYLGPIIGTTLLCIILGLWWGLFAAGIHVVMYIFVLSSSINGLCHHVGYRNFENTATNIRSVALLTGGEGLHNNHHEFPRSPKFSARRGEIDPAWPVIKFLAAIKLARPWKTIEKMEK